MEPIMSEKFIISFDTNVLRHTFEKEIILHVFRFGKEFDEILATAKEKGVLDDIKIIIPEIVLLELIEQKILSYEKHKEKLLNELKKLDFVFSNRLQDINVDLQKFDYRGFITKSAEQYLQEHNIEIVRPPKEKISRIFHRLTQKALRGDPPFLYNSQDEKSKKDLGFKDALAFETIREYLLEKQAYISYSGIYFISRDKVFKADVLSKEIVHFRHGLSVQQEGNALIRDILIKNLISKKLLDISNYNSFKEAVRDELYPDLSEYCDIYTWDFDYFNDYVLKDYHDENNFTAEIESIFAKNECQRKDGCVDNVFLSTYTEVKCVEGEFETKNPILDQHEIETINICEDEIYYDYYE